MERRSGEEAGGAEPVAGIKRAVAVSSGARRFGRRRKQPKKNAIILSFRTGDASHEKRSQGAEAGREERSRQQQ